MTSTTRKANSFLTDEYESLDLSESSVTPSSPGQLLYTVAYSVGPGEEETSGVQSEGDDLSIEEPGEHRHLPLQSRLTTPGKRGPGAGVATSQAQTSFREEMEALRKANTSLVRENEILKGVACSNQAEDSNYTKHRIQKLLSENETARRVIAQLNSQLGVFLSCKDNQTAVKELNTSELPVSVNIENSLPSLWVLMGQIAEKDSLLRLLETKNHEQRQQLKSAASERDSMEKDFQKKLIVLDSKWKQEREELANGSHAIMLETCALRRKVQSLEEAATAAKDAKAIEVQGLHSQIAVLEEEKTRTHQGMVRLVSESHSHRTRADRLAIEVSRKDKELRNLQVDLEECRRSMKDLLSKCEQMRQEHSNTMVVVNQEKELLAVKVADSQALLSQRELEIRHLKQRLKYMTKAFEENSQNAKEKTDQIKQALRTVVSVAEMKETVAEKSKVEKKWKEKHSNLRKKLLESQAQSRKKDEEHFQQLSGLLLKLERQSVLVDQLAKRR